MLAWEWWHPAPAKAPRLIRYLQDRDLWRFELLSSREVTAWIQSYPFDFNQWDILAETLAHDFGGVIAEGNAILRFKTQQVEHMCEYAQIRFLGGYKVHVANATCFFSEVGERLCELYPDESFAGYYFDRSEVARQWGLRSRGGFDVSKVAKEYGGGGHASASGFTEVSNG